MYKLITTTDKELRMCRARNLLHSVKYNKWHLLTVWCCLKRCYIELEDGAVTEEQSLNFHPCSLLNTPGVQYTCSVVEQEFQNSLCALDFSTTQKFGTNKSV